MKLERHKRGEFTVTKGQMEDSNKSQFELFNMHMKRIFPKEVLGWYAYKETEDGVHRFMWAEYPQSHLTREYLESLQKDGWQTMNPKFLRRR